MQKSVGLLIILFAFVLGYLGIKNLDEKKAEIIIGDMKLVAKSSESKTRGYVYLGGAILLLAVGTVLVVKKPTKS
jgi:hypothetical protein